MVKLDYERFARKIADAIRIKTKPNPGIEKAKKRFGAAFVNMLIRKREFSLESFSKKDQEKIKKLMDLDYGPLVYKSVSGRYRLKTETGELIRLVYTETDPRCVRLAKAFRNECWKRGCHVSVGLDNDMDSRTHLRLTPEHTLTELPEISKILAKQIDVRVYIGDKQDREWSRGFEKRLLLGAPASQKLMQIQDRRGVRWCLVGFPVEMTDRRYYLVPKKTYEKVYISSLLETYTKRTLRLCRYYRKGLESGDNVHITADDGTDLRLSIKGRPVLVADGIIDEEDLKRGDVGLNVPDGEAFLAPLEHSANGKIYFDFVNLPGIGFIKGGLWVWFRNGRVVKWKAGNKKGNQMFKKFLDSNTGEKDRIAELGIGTNHAAKFIGTIIVDEKIFGTIHIAIGNNTGAYHGKNRASSHLDMIKVMKGKNGNLWVDNRLVMKNGMPNGRI